MAITSPFSFSDHGIVEFAVPATSARPAMDWARAYPDERSDRLAAGQRVVIIAAVAAACWAAIGAVGLTAAWALGAF